MTKSRFLISLLFLSTILAALSLGQPTGQASRTSVAREIIQYLTWRSDDRRSAPMTFTCGQVRKERVAAKRLADLGSTALPELEGALTILEGSSEESSSSIGAGWILYTYAKIRGQAALPRLLKINAVPRLTFLQPNLDYAIALALNLTSYVSVSRQPGKVFHCHRHEEPRDTLDQVILAWLRNDPLLLQASLGPEATVDLKSMLKSQGSHRLHMNFGPDHRVNRAAVGYQFRLNGCWSVPEETLESDRDLGEAESLLERHRFRLETKFYTRSGFDCGRTDINFIKVPADADKSSLPYLINNSNVGALLRLINSCAERP